MNLPEYLTSYQVPLLFLISMFKVFSSAPVFQAVFWNHSCLYYTCMLSWGDEE